MPTTLTNGIQLPDKGSVDWYSSMQSNYNLIDTHLGDTDVHVTAEDKANWNSKQGSLSQDQLDAIAQVATNTDDIATLQSGKADASHTHSSSDITDIDDYATKDYVDNSISGLVDNAPDALNTLNELSAALNDDSNFASTVTTALAAKADSADLATVATSGSYTDLDDLPTIPTNTSDLTNDSNFVDSSSLAAVAISGDYDDLDNKPSIPTNTSDLNNDSGFVTLNDFDIPSKTSDLTNDSGFITSSDVPTSTSDLTNDSNFVDTSNPAVASGITSAKVTDYDAHIADTDIHVTTADKATWNTVTSKANDSDVVHKSGDETIAGVKSFSNDIIRGFTTISSRTITGSGNTSAIGSNGAGFLQNKATLTYQDSTPTKAVTVTLEVQDSAYSDGNSRAFFPNSNNITNLGKAGKRWANVYATSYYYGGSEVEFSQKFVTTDTAQTISGNKIFEGVNINLKSTTGEYGVSGGGLSATYLDKNSVQLAQIKLGNYTSGISYNKFSIFAYDSNNQLIERTLTFGSSNNALIVTYFRPDNDNIASLGTTGNRWSKVYATNYYYGSDNVEFSTKFVTTDTNQTISGAKTFSDTLTIYNNDSSQATKNLTISSSKIQVGDTSNSDTFGIVFNAGLSYVSRIMAFKDTSGTQNLQFAVRTKDSSNNFTGAMIRLRSYANGFNSFESDGDNLVSLGSSSNKWKNVNTYLVNGVEPSSLSLPDLSNGIDISSYIDVSQVSTNQYTPPANGWISISVISSSRNSIQIESSSGLSSRAYACTNPNNTNEYIASLIVPCVKNDTVTIYFRATSNTSTIKYAKFFPCQGNV